MVQPVLCGSFAQINMLVPLREGNHSKMTLNIDERDELRFDDDSHFDLLQYTFVYAVLSVRKKLTWLGQYHYRHFY